MMRDKLRTAVGVGLLSVLIWVLAERAVIRSTAVRVQVGLEAARPDVLMQFVNEQGQAVDDPFRPVLLQVKGPQSRIRGLEEGTIVLPAVTVSAEKLGYSTTGSNVQEFSPRVVDLLGGELRVEREGLYLRVTEATPEVMRVRATRLLRVPVEVKVFNELGRELPVERVEPARVEAYAPEGTTGAAEVSLTPAQQRQASSGPITVKAKLPALARPREADVTVQLPVSGSPWPEEAIQHPRVGVVKPASLEGKYRVVIEDLDAKLDLYSPLAFRGPAQERAEFRDSPYHLVLEVREEDLAAPSPARPLRYNLREGQRQIEILNPKSEAVRFRLEALPEAPAGEGGSRLVPSASPATGN